MSELERLGPLRKVPIGADLAARHPERFGTNRGDDRPSCPFCGHPTGDCTEEDHQMAPSKAKKAPAKAAAPRKRAAKKDDAVVVAQDSDADHVLALQGVNTHSIQQSKDWQSELRVVVGDVWLDRPAPGALPGETLRILQFHAGQVVNAAQLATAKDLGLTVKTRSVQESDLPGLI